MNFASKLLLITFITMYHQVIVKVSIACASRMPQFQTLIQSRDSPLNTQNLIFVVFIDATASMSELTNDLVENIPCTNKTQTILLLIMHVYFLKITTFLWIILILHPGCNSILLETVTIKFGGPRGRGPRADIRADIWNGGPRAEKNKKKLI